ncbi:MAG: hypothetical protein EBR82_77575 [Caulobacteraceae bacterium]|nr:hypothetical protein [Caulobacteraceae bacterium]
MFTLSNQGDVNASTYNYVAYCFAPVVGYSSMGSYVGNGSSDGVFVYTGMRPRFILIRSTGVENWIMIDTARDAYNIVKNQIIANGSDAEADFSSFPIDILSNGFKLRNSGGRVNGSSTTYIYAAFAESPFNYSRAR